MNGLKIITIVVAEGITIQLIIDVTVESIVAGLIVAGKPHLLNV